MNYRSLFSNLSLTLLLQVPVLFISSCSPQSLLQQSSYSFGEQQKEQKISGIAAKIKEKAEQFTVRIDYPNGNGSGVIIARQGNTYYVITAEHVVKQEQQYQVVTPDSKEYSVDYGNVKKLEGSDLAVLPFQSGETYQIATLADYKSEIYEDIEKGLKESEEMEKDLKELEEMEKGLKESETILEEFFKKLQQDSEKAKKEFEKLQESQYITPWLFLLGWSRFNENPQLRLSGGKGMPSEDIAHFAVSSFDALARSKSYKLSYTNFSQGGMSGGAVLDTTGRVIGIHAAAEGERAGLKEILLGFSLGVSIRDFLPLASQAGIKPEWLKVEKVRPKWITKEDEQSIAKNLFDIEPPGNNATEIDWLNYGNDLWRIERYQEASTAFDEAIKRKPDFYQAYYGKGLVVQTQVSTLMAEPFSYSSFLESSDQELYKQWSSYAQMHAKALPYFKKASEINPNFAPAWREQGRIKWHEFTAHLFLNEPTELYSNPTFSPEATLAAKEALAAFDKATALNPSDAGLYILKANLLEILSRKHEAIDAYSQAIKINPTQWNYASRSSAYCAVGDKQKAEADMNSAVKLGYYEFSGCGSSDHINPTTEVKAQNTSNHSIQIICNRRYDEASSQYVHTTLAWNAKYKKSIVVWKQEDFSGNGYPPQRRCEEVSPRFQQAYDNGSLRYITHGTMNGQPVICTARQVGGCNTLLITLKHQADAEKTLEQLSDVLLNYADAPLQQSSGKIAYSKDNRPYIEVDIEDFLSKP